MDSLTTPSLGDDMFPVMMKKSTMQVPQRVTHRILTLFTSLKVPVPLSTAVKNENDVTINRYLALTKSHKMRIKIITPGLSSALLSEQTVKPSLDIYSVETNVSL